jgi:hypothetical protein
MLPNPLFVQITYCITLTVGKKLPKLLKLKKNCQKVNMDVYVDENSPSLVTLVVGCSWCYNVLEIGKTLF